MKLVALLCLVACVVAPAGASAIVSHYGAVNPMYEGWALEGTGYIEHADVPTNTWHIDKPADVWQCQHSYVLDDASVHELDASGWLFMATFTDLSGPGHMTTDPTPRTTGASMAGMILNNYFWGILLGTSAENTLIVQGGNYGDDPIDTGLDASVLHAFRLDHPRDMAGTRSRLFVDGTWVTDLYGGYAGGVQRNQVRWGTAGGSAYAGDTAWRSLSLYAAPGLPAFALVGATPLAGLMLRRRR